MCLGSARIDSFGARKYAVTRTIIDHLPTTFDKRCCIAGNFVLVILRAVQVWACLHHDDAVPARRDGEGFVCAKTLNRDRVVCVRPERAERCAADVPSDPRVVQPCTLVTTHDVRGHRTHPMCQSLSRKPCRTRRHTRRPVHACPLRCHRRCRPCALSSR